MFVPLSCPKEISPRFSKPTKGGFATLGCSPVLAYFLALLIGLARRQILKWSFPFPFWPLSFVSPSCLFPPHASSPLSPSPEIFESRKNSGKLRNPRLIIERFEARCQRKKHQNSIAEATLSEGRVHEPRCSVSTLSSVLCAYCSKMWEDATGYMLWCWYRSCSTQESPGLRAPKDPKVFRGLPARKVQKNPKKLGQKSCKMKVP